MADEEVAAEEETPAEDSTETTEETPAEAEAPVEETAEPSEEAAPEEAAPVDEAPVEAPAEVAPVEENPTPDASSGPEEAASDSAPEAIDSSADEPTPAPVAQGESFQCLSNGGMPNTDHPVFQADSASTVACPVCGSTSVIRA